MTGAGGFGVGGGVPGGHPDSPGLTMDRALLVVRVGATPGQAYPIREADVTIGRTVPGMTVDINLSSQETGERYTVSRRHARVSWENGICMIRDLGSSAGTAVNGAAIPAPQGGNPSPGTPLSLGDRVTLGCVELEVATDG